MMNRLISQPKCLARHFFRSSKITLHCHISLGKSESIRKSIQCHEGKQNIKWLASLCEILFAKELDTKPEMITCVSVKNKNDDLILAFEVISNVFDNNEDVYVILEKVTPKTVLLAKSTSATELKSFLQKPDFRMNIFQNNSENRDDRKLNNSSSVGLLNIHDKLHDWKGMATSKGHIPKEESFNFWQLFSVALEDSMVPVEFKINADIAQCLSASTPRVIEYGDVPSITGNFCSWSIGFPMNRVANNYYNIFIRLPPGAKICFTFNICGKEFISSSHQVLHHTDISFESGGRRKTNVLLIMHGENLNSDFDLNRVSVGKTVADLIKDVQFKCLERKPIQNMSSLIIPEIKTRLEDLSEFLESCEPFFQSFDFDEENSLRIRQILNMELNPVRFEDVIVDDIVSASIKTIFEKNFRYLMSIYYYYVSQGFGLQSKNLTMIDLERLIVESNICNEDLDIGSILNYADSMLDRTMYVSHSVSLKSRNSYTIMSPSVRIPSLNSAPTIETAEKVYALVAENRDLTPMGFDVFYSAYLIHKKESLNSKLLETLKMSFSWYQTYVEPENVKPTTRRQGSLSRFGSIGRQDSFIRSSSIVRQDSTIQPNRPASLVRQESSSVQKACNEGTLPARDRTFTKVGISVVPPVSLKNNGGSFSFKASSIISPSIPVTTKNSFSSSPSVPLSTKSSFSSIPLKLNPYENSNSSLISPNNASVGNLLLPSDRRSSGVFSINEPKLNIPISLDLPGQRVSIKSSFTAADNSIKKSPTQNGSVNSGSNYVRSSRSSFIAGVSPISNVLASAAAKSRKTVNKNSALSDDKKLNENKSSSVSPLSKAYKKPNKLVSISEYLAVILSVAMLRFPVMPANKALHSLIRSFFNKFLDRKSFCIQSDFVRRCMKSSRMRIIFEKYVHHLKRYFCIYWWLDPLRPVSEKVNQTTRLSWHMFSQMILDLGLSNNALSVQNIMLAFVSSQYTESLVTNSVLSLSWGEFLQTWVFMACLSAENSVDLQVSEYNNTIEESVAACVEQFLTLLVWKRSAQLHSAISEALNDCESQILISENPVSPQKIAPALVEAAAKLISISPNRTPRSGRKTFAPSETLAHKLKRNSIGARN